MIAKEPGRSYRQENGCLPVCLQARYNTLPKLAGMRCDPDKEQVGRFPDPAGLRIRYVFMSIDTVIEKHVAVMGAMYDQGLTGDLLNRQIVK
jgi:hypothetical protein